MEITEQANEFLLSTALEGRSYPETAKALNVPRATLTQWELQHKDRYKHLALVRRIFLRKKFERITPREFLHWYDNTNRRCYYCKITEDEIRLLDEHKLIHTKRLTTRGRTLEIERIEPNEKYDNIKNLTYCCYWCNNAKSDEFSASEFIHIGKLIGDIWNRRIAKIRENQNP